MKDFSTWSNGLNDQGTVQDDMAILAGATNGFGYRADGGGGGAGGVSEIGGAFRAGEFVRAAGVDARGVRCGVGAHVHERVASVVARGLSAGHRPDVARGSGHQLL